MDFFQKFPTEKIAMHLKIFLGVIRNIWQGRNACDNKKIQHPPPSCEGKCDICKFVNEDAQMLNAKFDGTWLG